MYCLVFVEDYAKMSGSVVYTVKIRLVKNLYIYIYTAICAVYAVLFFAFNLYLYRIGKGMST